MKKTVLWGALFTLIGTQLHAENTETIIVPQTTTPNNIVLPKAPQNEQSVQSTTIINCDYKIPAQTKIDEATVLTWSQNALIQSFSFNPDFLDAQMQKLQACFTDQGWTGFNTALQKSGNLEAIKSQKLTVSSQIDGPVLMREAKDNQWKITLPLVAVYQNDKDKVSQLLTVDLTVGRKTTGDLGIMQMIASPRGTVTTKNPNVPPSNPENRSLDTKPNQTTSTGSPAQ